MQEGIKCLDTSLCSHSHLPCPASRVPRRPPPHRPPATLRPLAAASAAPAAPVHDGRPVEITANDTMKFSVTEIAAKPGEKLSVTLVNLGTTPKFSMGHNWLLLAARADVQPFLVAAAEAITTDYVPRGDAEGPHSRGHEAPRSRRSATP